MACDFQNSLTPIRLVMTHAALFKTVFIAALLGMVVVLSCTDHTDPEPATNCTLVSGAPRLFPCEFEIQKVEFCNKLNVNDIFATVTGDNPNITLPLAMAWNSFHPTPGSVDATFKVKLHIKRISAPSFNSSFEYIIPKVIGQVPVTAQTFDISHFPPLFPPVPVELNMQVDQTLVIFADANYHATEKSSPSGELSYTALSGNVMFLIYNMATASILAAEPHNYPTILDVSEGRIAINPTLVQ